MMAGALSFESQYLVNGVVVNENLAQALTFSSGCGPGDEGLTGCISASTAARRGVVNMITKSGGNSQRIVPGRRQRTPGAR